MKGSGLHHAEGSERSPRPVCVSKGEGQVSHSSSSTPLYPTSPGTKDPTCPMGQKGHIHVSVANTTHELV